MLKQSSSWDAENYKATYTIEDECGRQFIGTAIAHEEDYDFATELAGTEIAYLRATIKYLQSIKRDILKPQLAALKQLYYSINRSKQFNPKSYESKMLFNQIEIKEEDIKAINIEIYKHKEFLRDYINNKDKAFKILRKRRARQVSLDENN